MESLDLRFPNKFTASMGKQALFRDQQLTAFLDKQLFPSKCKAFLDLLFPSSLTVIGICVSTADPIDFAINVDLGL